MRTVSGRVVSTPRPVHRCNPGVRHETLTEPDDWGGLPAGTTYAIPPTPWEFPKGTVWECACGRRWVSRGAIYVNEPGGCYWYREGLPSRLWRRLFDRDRNAEDLAETSAWERGKADTR